MSVLRMHGTIPSLPIWEHMHDTVTGLTYFDFMITTIDSKLSMWFTDYSCMTYFFTWTQTHIDQVLTYFCTMLPHSGDLVLGGSTEDILFYFI